MYVAGTCHIRLRQTLLARMVTPEPNKQSVPALPGVVVAAVFIGIAVGAMLQTTGSQSKSGVGSSSVTGIHRNP